MSTIEQGAKLATSSDGTRRPTRTRQPIVAWAVRLLCRVTLVLAAGCAADPADPVGVDADGGGLAQGLDQVEKATRPTDVIVVGAGFAGLAAARALHNAGLKVIVLEAKDYVGGRARTIQVGDVTTELGAMWLDGVKGNPVAKIAKTYKAKYVPYTDWGCGSFAPGIRAYDAVLGAQFDFEQLIDYGSDFADESLGRLRKKLPASASVQDGSDLYVVEKKPPHGSPRLALPRGALDRRDTTARRLAGGRLFRLL